MFYAILGVHLVLCAILVGLVLLQQGKGADMGAAFGGGSNSLFGAGGATALITKVTTGVAVAFFVTSVILVNQFARISPSSRTSENPLGGSVMNKEMVPQTAAAPGAQPADGQVSPQGDSNPSAAKLGAAVDASAHSVPPGDRVAGASGDRETGRSSPQ